MKRRAATRVTDEVRGINRVVYDINSEPPGTIEWECQETAAMAKREGRWVRVKVLAPEEKAVVAAVCERFIAEILKPRFLPEIRPTSFNYPIDIFGKWRGSKYSFITRYRSGFPDNIGEEFDSAFTRLEHVEECLAETRFDVMWHRHTGQWLHLHSAVTLEEALRLI